MSFYGVRLLARKSVTPWPPLVTSPGENSLPSGSACFMMSTRHCTTVPLCWNQSSCRWWLSKAASISKHGGACHSVNEALDDWWPRVSCRGGTSLEQLGHLSSRRPHQCQYLSGDWRQSFHTLIPYRLMLNRYLELVASNLCLSLFLSRDLEVPQNKTSR